MPTALILPADKDPAIRIKPAAQLPLAEGEQPFFADAIQRIASWPVALSMGLFGIIMYGKSEIVLHTFL